MSESYDPKVAATQFTDQLTALKDAAASAVDPCLVAKYIAASDPRVRDLFLRKIAAGYVFRGIRCVDRFGIPENKYVVFDFDCKPGTFCLIKPAFLVVVNIIDGYVVAIVDPFIPTQKAMQGPGCGCKQRAELLEDCVSVTIEDGEACLEVGDFGELCVPCPGVPDATAAEACIKFCNFGLRVRIKVKVLGNVVGCARFGTGSGCDC